MTKGLLLATTALALAIVSTKASVAQPRHSPHVSTVLYTQNSNFGQGIDSQNFSSAMSAYDSVGADDFVVPAGKTWHITEIDVTGSYIDGSGPATSEVVTFWASSRRIVHHGADSFTLTCADNSGSFACTLPLGSGGKPVVRLSGGSAGKEYWVSVVANCDFATCGEWNWTRNTTQNYSQAVWKNPKGGWGNTCRGWGTLQSCFGIAPSDFAFAIIGYQ